MQVDPEAALSRRSGHGGSLHTCVTLFSRNWSLYGLPCQTCYTHVSPLIRKLWADFWEPLAWTLLFHIPRQTNNEQQDNDKIYVLKITKINKQKKTHNGMMIIQQL